MGRSVLDPSGFVDLLGVEIAGYRAILVVLEAERDALRTAAAEALLGITAAKLEHVSALHSLARDRMYRLELAGCSDMGAGLDAWLAGSPYAASVREAWEMLRDLATKANRANDLNGRLIARQRRHFDAAYAALLQAAGAPPLYGADGRPQSRSTGRSLAAV